MKRKRTGPATRDEVVATSATKDDLSAPALLQCASQCMPHNPALHRCSIQRCLRLRAERKAREKEEAQRMWRGAAAAVLDGALDARISEAAVLRSQIRC